MTDIKNKLIKASQIYADQTIIRVGINAIPYIGGSIDVLLSSLGQNYVTKRIEIFISELHDQITSLEDSKVNHDFFEKEEGFDLIVKAFNSASRTRQQEKLRIYAKIIKGAITEGKKYQEEEPELYLKIVEELSIKELRVAKILYDLKEKNKEGDDSDYSQDGMSNDAWMLSKKYSEFNKDELISIFVRLEKTGLIKELVGTFIGYGGGVYLINQLFKNFITFIEGLD